jgi:hypothetical protein
VTTIKRFQTKYLSNTNIKKILDLKNKHWKHGIKSQKKFFKTNMLPNDYHVLLFSKKKLIGYTAFRKRKIILNSSTRNYLLLDTIVILKKFRKKNLIKKLMLFNVDLIRKSKKCSFLFCNKARSIFFKKYKWRILPKSKLSVEDKVTSKYCMYFNFNFNLKKKLAIKIFTSDS